MKNEIIKQARKRPIDTKFTPNSIFPFFIEMMDVKKILIKTKLKIERYGDVEILINPKKKNIKLQTIAPKIMIGSWFLTFKSRESLISFGGKKIFDKEFFINAPQLRYDISFYQYNRFVANKI